MRMLPMQQISPDLAWNVAVGLRKPDDALRGAINTALDKLARTARSRASMRNTALRSATEVA